MSLSEKAGDLAKDVCDIVSKEFGDWCKSVTEKVIDFPCRPTIEINRNGSIKSIGVNCKVNTDSLNKGIQKIVTWFNEDVIVYGQKITCDMIEGIYKDKGIDIGTNTLNFIVQAPNLAFDSRFRAVNDYAIRNGFAAGFPNFHQADYGDGIVFGTILLKHDIVEVRVIPAAELGDLPDIETRFRAINDYAVRNGFAAGFPNFHQADYGDGVVFGVILLKHDEVEVSTVSAAELGDLPDIEIRFRAINDYAVRNSFSAGFPNFHQADYGDGVVFGVILLKNDSIESKVVNIATLFPPQINVHIIERSPSRPPAKSWEEGARIRPWDR